MTKVETAIPSPKLSGIVRQTDEAKKAISAMRRLAAKLGQRDIGEENDFVEVRLPDNFLLGLLANPQQSMLAYLRRWNIKHGGKLKVWARDGVIYVDPIGGRTKG